MIDIAYLSSEDTPNNAKFILLKDIMQRLEKTFPTFIIRKYTDAELGRQLSTMGYEYKKQSKGASYRMKER